MDKTELHHFVLSEGIVKYVKDMPEKPFMFDVWYKPGEAMSPSNRRELSRYNLKLQSAIASAVEVSNQEEVKDALLRELNWNPHRDEHRFDEGVVYSLRCRVEVKQIEVPCPDGIEGCEVLHLRPLALVTFEEKKEEQKDVELSINYVFDGKSWNVTTRGTNVKAALISFVKYYAFDSIESYTPNKTLNTHGK